MPGVSRALSYDLGVPPEHLDHTREFGYWFAYLRDRFNVRMDADDTIVLYLYDHGMLIDGADVKGQDRLILKTKSEKMLTFLSEHNAEIDALICESPGYIGSRARKRQPA